LKSLSWLKYKIASKLKNLNKTQILIGLTALFIGFIIYFFYRYLNSVYLFNKLFVNALSSSILNNTEFFKIFVGSLPSLLHVFAFILLTAGVINSKNKLVNNLICVFWFFIDTIFEFGQKYKYFFCQIVPDWFDKFFILENFKSYFLKGSFDIFDILAIILGTILAKVLLTYFIKY